MATSPRPKTDRTTGNRRTKRLLVGTGLAAASLLLGACGFNAQTTQPYTPAEGVNADVGTYQTEPAVKVRNLMVLTRAENVGFLSATLYGARRDSLTAVSATALKPDGTPLDSGNLTVEVTNPVSFSPQSYVVLTDRTAIPVTGPLTAGLNVELTLTFEQAGQLKIIAPIVNADTHEYVTVSPSPVPSTS